MNTTPALTPDLKIIIFGEEKVGKTSLYQRLLHDRFNEEYHSTIALDFMPYETNFKGKTEKFQIWDVSGNSKFRGMINNFFKNVNGALMVYDVNSRESFNKLPIWINDFQNSTREEETECYIIGMKSDMPIDEHNPKGRVTKEEGKQLAQKYNFSFFEYSAKTENNQDLLKKLNRFFKKVFNKNLKKYKQKGHFIDESLILLSEESLRVTTQNIKRCCL